jgi:hypothetical protein
VRCSLIDEYVKKPSAHGMSTFKGSSVKCENARFYRQKKLFFGTMPFSPWAILAIWLHIGAPQKL